MRVIMKAESTPISDGIYTAAMADPTIRMKGKTRSSSDFLVFSVVFTMFLYLCPEFKFMASLFKILTKLTTLDLNLFSSSNNPESRISASV